MDKREYHKLIRDRIPEILTEKGKKFQIQTLSEADFETALRAKLVEEAQEVAAASDRDEMLKELADLAEVVKSMCALKTISMDDIERVRVQRAEERGSFAKRLQLDWAETD